MKKLATLIIAVFYFSATQAQAYKIVVKIPNWKNQEIILGHHKADLLIPDDTVKANSKGIAVFKGKKPLQQGMYFIYLPNKSSFDFIVGKDQFFTIENDTSDLVNNFKSVGSIDNQAFEEYQKYAVQINKEAEKIRKDKNLSKKERNKKLVELGNELEKKYQEIVEKYPQTFFVTFLKATREVQVPDTIKDRKAQYEYYKKHYFDNFDVSDARLLYTPIYKRKIDFYLDKLVPPFPDSVIAACDTLLKKADKAGEETYKYMLIHLYNKYVKSQLMIAENIFVHIADIYIKRATWSTDSFKNELRTKLVRKKNCLIGQKAKPIDMIILPSDSSQIELLRVPLKDMKESGLKIENDKSRTFEEKLPDLSQLIADYMAYFPNDVELYSIDAPYTILWFLSPTCSHCKEETPKFFKEYKEKLKPLGVVVMAIYLEKPTDNWAAFCHDINIWFDFVEKNHFYDPHWLNVWNPFANYRFKYDISSTPILYLLDKDKKIIAKRIGYEQAIQIIQEEMKKKK